MIVVIVYTVSSLRIYPSNDIKSEKFLKGRKFCRKITRNIVKNITINNY